MSWFKYIIIFSLVNSVLTLAGISWAFFSGLGITQLIDGIALILIEQTNTTVPLTVKAIAFLFDLAMTGVLAFFVILAQRLNRWAYIGGMAIYILDALLLVVLQSWLTFAFHLYVLWHLWRGFQATRILRRLEEAGTVTLSQVQRSVVESRKINATNKGKFLGSALVIAVLVVVVGSALGSIWLESLAASYP